MPVYELTVRFEADDDNAALRHASDVEAGKTPAVTAVVERLTRIIATKMQPHAD